MSDKRFISFLIECLVFLFKNKENPWNLPPERYYKLKEEINRRGIELDIYL